jgi:hypothetical protein
LLAGVSLRRAFRGRCGQTSGHDRFDWFKDDSIVLEEQLPTAIYFNERNHLVIRQRAEYRDEDAFIYIAPQNIAEFVDRLTDVVGIPSVGNHS